MTIESRVKRYKALCKHAARKLGCKADDPRCAYYATLELAREQITARLISGRDVDAAALLKIDEAKRQLIPPEVPKIEIVLVDGIVGICPHCKKECPDYRKPAPPRAVANPDPKPEAPPTLPAENVVPLRRNPGSIHDQASAPVQTYTEPWRSPPGA